MWKRRGADKRWKVITVETTRPKWKKKPDWLVGWLIGM